MKEIEECKIIERENLGTYQSSSGIAIKTTRAIRKKRTTQNINGRKCACGLTTHVRRSSKLCPQNEWTKQQITEWEVSKMKNKILDLETTEK